MSTLSLYSINSQDSDAVVQKYEGGIFNEGVKMASPLRKLNFC